MTDSAAPRMTIVDLPKDELSCVVRHLQQDAWQRDQRLDDVAALRSVCRSLRHAVDSVVTHAAFHANVGVVELHSTIRRCTGLHTVKLQQLHPEAAGPMWEALLAVPHLRSLNLPEVGAMQPEDWTRLSGLTHLTLHDTVGSRDGTLAAMLPRLTALQSLVLPNCFLSAADMQLGSLSRLTHLDLGVAEGVPAVAAQLPNLQSLALQLSHTASTDDGPWVTALSDLSELSPLLPLTRLRRLSLVTGTEYGEELTLCSDGTVSPHNTRSVGDAYGNRPGQCAILPLQGVCHLAALYGVRGQAALDLAPWPPDAPFRRPASEDLLRAVSPCNTLRELRLTCYEVTAEDVADLAAAAGRLRVLHLAGCSGALAPLLQAATAAGDVVLNGAQGGIELLAALRPAAGTLRRLDIMDLLNEMRVGCPTPQLLGADAEHLAALSRLTSLQCGNHFRSADDEVADEAADSVPADAFDAIAQLTLLRELYLRSTPSFDDAQLHKLSTLRGLTSLGLNAAAGGGGGADAGQDEDRNAVDVREGVAGSWLDAFAAAHVPLRDLGVALMPGCGTEAAIGRLTQLTSLQLSVGARPPIEGVHSDQQIQRWLDSSQRAPALQLQLLGCGCATRTAGGSLAAARNTRLQDLTLRPTGRLSDDEVAAAAAALPDLRRLDIYGFGRQDHGVLGFTGAGLGAYSACRRLRDISLTFCSELEGQPLLEQLPHIASLASLKIYDCPRVGSGVEEELQAAFQARHGRRLKLEFDLDPQSYL